MRARVEAAAGELIGRSVPGLSVLIANAERTIGDTSLGHADLATAAPMTSSTRMNWFSMTKLVTATAAVQLADRDELDLDAPVAQYYEPFADLEPGDWSASATVRHLLSHSAGVANPLPLRWVHLADEVAPDRAAFVSSLLSKHRRLRFEPGAKAAYTNVGYLVLGEVISNVAGVPFDDYVQTNVLEPLGMRETGFDAPPRGAWATPYQRRFTPLSALLPVLLPRRMIGAKVGWFVALNHFLVNGAAYGGLVGPPVDAIRFARAHLRGGELDGVRILSDAACSEMRTIIARGRGLEVGLGWFRRGAPSDRDYVEHLGGGAGFWTCLRIYPDRDAVAVVMGNATSYEHDAVVRAGVPPIDSSYGARP